MPAFSTLPNYVGAQELEPRWSVTFLTAIRIVGYLRPLRTREPVARVLRVTAMLIPPTYLLWFAALNCVSPKPARSIVLSAKPTASGYAPSRNWDHIHSLRSLRTI